MSAVPRPGGGLPDGDRIWEGKFKTVGEKTSSCYGPAGPESSWIKNKRYHTHTHCHGPTDKRSSCQAVITLTLPPYQVTETCG